MTTRHIIHRTAQTVSSVCVAAVALAVALPISAETAAPNAKASAGKATAQKAKPEPNQPPRIAKPAASPTRQAMLDYLMAELAGQRGSAAVATESMLELAQRNQDAAIAARAVELSVRVRDVALATRASALWLELDPESQAGSYLSDLLGEQKAVALAAAEVKRLVAASRDKRPLLMHLNMMFARFSDKKEVRAAIEEIAGAHADSAEAHYSRGWAAVLAADPAAALTAAETALTKRPGWEKAAILKHAVLGKQPGDAAAVFAAEFLKNSPEASEFRLAHARELAGDRKYREARVEFERVAKARPKDSIVAFSNALLAQQLEEWDAAIAEYQRALDLNYRDDDAIFGNLAQIAENRKRYSEAREWLARIQGRDAARNANRRIAQLIAKSDGPDQGRAYLATLPIESKSDRVQTALTEAQILREAKRYQVAYEVLDRANAQFPNEPELMYDLAMAAEKIGKIDVLESNLRQLIEIKPDFSHAYNALGYTYAERGMKLDEAKALIEKAVALSPDDPFILDSLGWVHYRLGNLVEAAKHLQSAYEVRRDPEIAAHLSEVLWAKGRKDEALAIIKRGLNEHPEHEMLTSMLQKLKP